MPFELNAGTPEAGMSMKEYFGSRMPPERIEMMHEALKERADEVGLPLNPPTTISNTRKAHQLAEYAREQGRYDAVHLPLFQAYFVRGENLSDEGVLRRVAAEAGLDADAAMTAVRDGRCEQQVNAKLQQARRYGINSVPTFIINERYKVVGAQPYDALLQAFRRVMQEG